MTEQFNKEQRRNIALRRLIVTGNCLSFWVGRIPENAGKSKTRHTFTNGVTPNSELRGATDEPK